VFLETDVGGGTTTDRAIHSTALEEHHLGPSPSRFRYHLVLGDGHRSHFSLALQVGATALALKGVFFRPDLILPLPGLTSPGRRTLWLQALKSFNRLAAPGNPPRAHPLALKIQRLYLDGARRYADAQPGLPGWVTWLLDTWEQTLARLAADDRDWLAARLDPWIKYELYSTWLKENGYSWHDLAHRPELLDELALLDQHYHEFTRDDSPFRVLEQAGLLAHRLAPTPAPGSEPEPFVPATATRAAARARFIRNHCDHPDLVMDWAEVFDQRTGRRRSLAEPFAADFGPWEPGTP
jgi:hypothetical protein